MQTEDMKSTLRKFYGRYGDLIKQYEVFPLTNVKWHSVTWPYIMTTPLLIRLCTELDLYRILSGFLRTFATGVACRQGTLTPPDTWSRLFGTCICSACWDQSFFRTCHCFSGLCSSDIPRYFLDFAFWCLFALASLRENKSSRIKSVLQYS